MATRNMMLTDEEINVMDQLNLHQSPSHHEAEDQATSERHDVGSDEKYVELKREIAEVDKHMIEMKAYVDNSTKLIIDEIKSLRGEQRQATHQHDDFRQHVEESEKTQMDQPSVPMMDGRPWEDRASKIYQAKCSSNPLSYNTVDCWLMSWVNNIEKQWRESNRDKRSISLDHDVGHCIRGFKLLANIPWDTVDDVIIPKVNEAVGKLATMISLFLMSTKLYCKRLDLYADKLSKYVNKSQSDPLDIKHMQAPQQADSSNDCGLYACIFAEHISDGVFDMEDVEIDTKYHREMYATILWHYGKTKNEDGAISESEVTGTVTSKFGGPRIAKEHVPDTTNYPTPILLTRKLK
ncbi:hypothetical protein KY285_006317 [Solanum tuberosum]|nr:hypothetical protein KY285_006317 [Solanum tuberosum]